MLMKLFLIFSITFLVIVHGADHNTFKSCAENPLCSKFRSAHPTYESLYSFDRQSMVTTTESLKGNLVNIDNNTLELEVRILTSRNAHVTIQELGGNRYRLEDVLNGEPEYAVINEFATDGSSISIRNRDLNTTVNITYSPFAISIFFDDELQLVAGKRLIFDKESQAFTFEVTYPQASSIYGIHEHADSLLLQDTYPDGPDPYRLRNLDVSGFELNSTMALYGSVPVLYGHGTQSTSGIFLHNAAEQWMEVTKNSSGSSNVFIIVESGMLDVFLLPGPKPKDVVRQYTSLTGVAHLPQLWALGYHQCRWNYDNESDVKNVIANMDSHNFPMDVIWLDIEYTNGKRYFTWDSVNFGDPVEMQQNISSTGRKLVTIIDPHIKVDPNYDVYSGALEKDLFVKNSNGSVFEGDCWPGTSSYMDFLNPEARNYYSSFYSFEKFVGSTETLAGIWNDMNEPSVFDDSIEKTIPGDALHFGGVRHRDIHNIYGLLHTKSTHQGLMDRDGGKKRPFVLSRSHFAGSQRYAAIWTGDNTAQWGYLAASYSECLNANMLGIVFCGSDIGGFDGEPDDELMQRWYQAAAWVPFYRQHANMGTKRREPYLFSDDVQEVIRNALKLRYQHLYVLYTLFYEHTRYGDPIIRPLFYEYPEDANVFGIDTQLLFGKNILVKAVIEPGVSSVSVYLPGENDLWYHINDKNIYAGGQSYDIAVTIDFIPVFYKSGGIVALKTQNRSASEFSKADQYTLIVNLDKEEKATGTLYIDDYESFEYDNNNNFTYIQLAYENDALTTTLIDGSNDFEAEFESIVVNKLSTEKGIYTQTIYTTNANGHLLADIKVGRKKSIEIKL